MMVALAQKREAMDNPLPSQEQAKDWIAAETRKFKAEMGVGLTFVGLSFISPASVLSASNSSRFSYMNFCRDDETVAAAREALDIFRLQSWAVSGVLGVMAYVATKRSLFWGIATLLVGGITTELLLMDMHNVVDRAERRNKLGAGVPDIDMAAVARNPGRGGHY